MFSEAYYTAMMVLTALVGIVLFIVYAVNGFDNNETLMSGWLFIALSMGFEYKADKAEERRVNA